MDLLLNEFVVAVLWVGLLAVAIHAGIGWLSRRRVESRARRRRLICRLCMQAYEDAGNERVIACPRCGAPNERGHDPRRC